MREPAASAAATRGRAVRLGCWIALLILLLGGHTAWLIALRGEAILHDHSLLFGGWLLGGIACLLLLVLLKTTPKTAIRTSPTTGGVIVVVGTLWLQVAAVVLLPPALSEDVLRYRADGKLWLLGESPYANPPARLREVAATEADLPLDVLDAGVQFQDTRTIYLPVSQAAFVAGTSLEVALLPEPPTVEPEAVVAWRQAVLTLPWWQRATVLRAMMGLAVVLTAAVLVRALAEARRSVWWAVLFAWHPLVVVEAGGMGHQDFLGVLLLALMIRRLQRDRAARAGVLLGLAALVKPHVLLLLPWAMRRVGGRYGLKRAMRVPVATAVAVLLPCALLMPWDGGLAGWWGTFSKYTGGWEANGGFYRGLVELLPEMLPGGFDVKATARLIGGLVAVAAVAAAWVLRSGVTAGAYVALLGLVLVSPVAYPWYLSWALVPAVLLGPRPGAGGLTALVWAATAGMSYQLWHEPAWRLPWPWLAAEYVPVAVALVVELALVRRRRGRELGRRPIP